MAKMWAGVTAGKTDQLADDFNSSIRFDSRMFREDITGSIAHAAMLAARGIITPQDCEALPAFLRIWNPAPLPSTRPARISICLWSRC